MYRLISSPAPNVNFNHLTRTLCVLRTQESEKSTEKKVQKKKKIKKKERLEEEAEEEGGEEVEGGWEKVKGGVPLVKVRKL